MRDNFNLMLSAICPRPTLLVSTVSKNGVGNLAPYGHLTIGGASPPSICICAMTDINDKPKDTFQNIMDTGEFVLNVCTRDFIGRANECSRAHEEGEDELDIYGFTPMPSVLVKPVRVQESPVQMECKLFDTFSHGSGPLSSHYIIGEIMMFHVLEDLISIDGLVDPQKLQFIGRLGMDWFCETIESSLFEIPRIK